MKNLYLQSLPMTLGAAALAAATLAVATADAAPPSPPWFTWATVVNNNDLMPARAPTSTPRRRFSTATTSPR